MNENINLREILDGCPVGTEFYNDTFGVLRFRGMDTSFEYPLMFTDAHYNNRFFTPDGKFFMSTSSNCKVSIFPLDTQRDWSKFERFWDKSKIERFDPKTLKPFDKVLVCNDNDTWQVEFFSHICQYEPNGWCQCSCDSYYYCIPYNEETKHLVGTTEEAPEYYRYWED